MRAVSPFNSLRDCRIGLPTSAVSVLASRSCRSISNSRKFGKDGEPLLDRDGRPFGLRRAGQFVLGADRLQVVGGNFGDDAAGGGIHDLHGGASSEA